MTETKSDDQYEHAKPIMETADVDPIQYKRWLRAYQAAERRKEARKQKRAELKRQYANLTNERLKAALEVSLPQYYWTCEYHPEGMDGRQRVDVAGTPASADHLVLVEIERGRMNPSDNVIKCWRYADTNRNCPPILLVQLFSPYYPAWTSQARGMRNAIFIGEKGEEARFPAFCYRHVDPEHWPPPETDLLAIAERIRTIGEDWLGLIGGLQ